MATKPANWKKKDCKVCTNSKKAFPKKKIEVSSLWTPQEINKYSKTIPQRQDVEVLPADDPDKQLLGWTMTEKVGTILVNPRAVVRANNCQTCEHWNKKKSVCKIKPKKPNTTNCKWKPNEEYRIEQKGW